MSTKQNLRAAAKAERATAQVLNDIFAHSNRMLGYADRSADVNLAELTVGQGQLAFAVMSKSSREIRRDHLQRIAAFTLGWLERIKGPDEDPFTLITAERRRQRELLRAGKFNLDVSHPTPDETRKLRVLVEEVGEVAEAIDKLEAAKVLDLKQAMEHLRAELTQVCTVCVAWLESMEAKP